MNTMQQLLAGAALSLTLAANATAGAPVIDSGTPSASALGAFAIDANDWFAGEVSFAQAATLDSIQVYITGASQGDTFDLTLYADGAGQPGAVAQASAQVTFSADGWNGLSGLASSASAGAWNVAVGNYWIGIEVLGSSTMSTGMLNVGASNTGASGTSGLVNTAWYSVGSTAGYSRLGLGSANQFGLQVGAVPEPSTWATLALGLALLGGSAVARRRLV
jgi:hypothetical protein